MWRLGLVGRRYFSKQARDPTPPHSALPRALAKYKDPIQLVEKLKERVPKHGFLVPTLLHAEQPSSIAQMVRNFTVPALAISPQF